jgi:N-acetylglucosaminyldiphosphoundecaprenol N-acetyl-beta-D-mannosaminyltransferase
MDGLARRSLFGLRFVDSGDLDAVAADILRRAQSEWQAFGTSPVVVTPNVDQLIMLSRHPRSRAAALVNTAHFVLPDGQPIVLASRLLGRPLRGRLTGSDLTSCMWKQLATSGRPCQVIASNPAVAEQLRAEHPNAQVTVAPILDASKPAEIAAYAAQCIADTAERRPEFVFVTLGFPQREVLIQEMLEQWPDHEPPTLLAVGASFDMHFGLRRRAPQWIQKASLEWFYRFVQEPRRLFARYFLRGPSFFKIVWQEWRYPAPVADLDANREIARRGHTQAAEAAAAVAHSRHEIVAGE